MKLIPFEDKEKSKTLQEIVDDLQTHVKDDTIVQIGIFSFEFCKK